jgi:acylphosphatase
MTGDNAQELKQINVVVRGRVQGVYFRQSTARLANTIGVKGWVRNQTDGTVEVMAVGTPVQLNQLLGFLRRGPRAAEVDDVETEVVTPVESFAGFYVR